MARISVGAQGFIRRHSERVGNPRGCAVVHRNQTHYKVKKEIRRRCLFAQHSLLRESALFASASDCCRNMLIYWIEMPNARFGGCSLCPASRVAFCFAAPPKSADLCADLSRR